MVTTGQVGPIQRQQALARRGGLIRILVLCFLLAVLTYPPAIEAQCVRGAVMCTNHATLPQRTCSASVMCSGFPGTSTGTLLTAGSNNVISCSPTSTTIFTPGTLMIVAVANPTAPTSRSCSWDWNSGYESITGSFSITTADGLPVELMDFSIDDPALEDSADGAGLSSEAGSDRD